MPMTRPCPECGSQIPFALVYPMPEINSHWVCPHDGSRWDLADDGSALVRFGSIRREAAGRPRRLE